MVHAALTRSIQLYQFRWTHRALGIPHYHDLDLCFNTDNLESRAFGSSHVSLNFLHNNSPVVVDSFILYAEHSPQPMKLFCHLISSRRSSTVVQNLFYCFPP
jgi:hypothetical protein